MNSIDKITWKHLQKYLTCQKYFVWNDFKNDKSLEDDDDENFWSLEFDENEDDKYDYVEVHKTGFNIIQNRFTEWIEKKYSSENINLSIIKEKDFNLGIARTKDAMSNPNIDVILFPVFEYNGAVSKPTLYNKREKLISNLNLNTSTKRVDYIRAFFDFEVVSKNNYPVTNISILTIEIKDFKKNDELTFDETFYANTTTSKPKAKSQTIPALKEAALGTEEKMVDNIFQKISKRQILNLSPSSKKEQLSLFGIDYYISRIKEAKKFDRMPINHNDNTLWGANKWFNEIAQEDFPHMLPLSGTLLNKKKIIEFSGDDFLLNEFYDSHITTSNMKNHIDVIDYERLDVIIDSLNNKNVVWYDFEGFSLPFPLMEYTFPYQQLIFQVSVIKTVEDKIIDINNVVIDPKFIEYSDFFKIIDAIYVEDADAYVVYNKSYENSKLKSMADIFFKHELLKRDPGFSRKIKIYNLKIESIISKTVDLLDLFKLSSLSGALPPIFLWELYGFSSIKKIEKYITKKNYDLEVMIEPYSELTVQNGLMAMSKAIDRRLGGIGDNEWLEAVEDLKKYCENDVKAMLMVYHFAKKLLKER
ncbi:MAG: DUF2779 domain-containing protein [Mycoplasmataceae bacterium]|nr:DUF2779 domain-containing protein [Mycoplasmataceae bacterium]